MTSATNPDLPARLKTAIILIVLFLAIASLAIYSSSGAKLFSGLVFALVSIAGYEFCKLPTGQSAIQLFSRIALILIPAAVSFLIGVFLVNSYPPQTILAIYFSIIIMVLAIGLSLYSMQAKLEDKLEKLFFALARDGLGFLLIGVGGSATVLIALIAPLQALLLVTIVAIADSAAYFSGRSYGKKKIAPVVSPKKTVVGTLVGILTGTAAGMILYRLSPQANFIPWHLSLLYSAAIVICSQSGDYTKSIIKRHYDVKDFGRIFPGHGGVLDRLDGILGAAPLVLILAGLVCSH